MARRQLEQDRDPISIAIERVLEAEQSAAITLRNRRQQAEALVAAARERAAAIARRTETRITKLHTAYFNKVNTEVAKLAEAPISTREADDGSIVDDTKLVKAVQRLAAKLTGGT